MVFKYIALTILKKFKGFQPAARVSAGFKAAVCGGLFLALIGCGLRLGEVFEHPPSGKGEQALGCMNELGQQFQDYLNQNLMENEVGEFAGCLQTALLIFKYHVWGENRQFYTPEELRDFINEFFLLDKRINDNLMREFMVLKTALAGGSSELLTPREIDRIIEVIEALKKPALLIYPYNKMLFKGEPESLEKTEEGLQVLRKALLSTADDLFQNTYSLESAGRLAVETRTLLEISSKGGGGAVPPSWFLALKTIKSFVFSQPYEKVFVRPQEWKQLFSSGLDLFSTLIYSKRALGQGLLFQHKVKSFSKSFESLLSFAEKAGGSNFARIITKKDIMELLEVLKNRRLIPDNIRVSSLRTALSALFGKIISRQGSSEDFVFSAEEYFWLKSQYENWRGIQSALNRAQGMFKNQPSYSMERIFLFPALREKLFSQFAGPIEKLAGFRPLYNENSEDDFNIYILNDQRINRKAFAYKSLSFNHFYSVAAGMIISGYAKNFPKIGMSETELAQALKDIYGLLKDLGAQMSNVDPDAGTFGRTEFLAANLLTYETKGYYTDSWGFIKNKKTELIHQRELTEYLSFVQFIFKTLNALNMEMDRLCERGLSKTCFYENILNAVENSITNMPHLISALAQMPRELRELYTHTLFKMAVVRLEDIQNLEQLNLQHLRNLVLAFMYQEVMISRFDANFSNTLEEEEVISAFPLYQGMIQYVGRDLLCLDVEEMIDTQMDFALYLYSAYNQGPPNFEKIRSQWMGKERLWVNLKFLQNGLWIIDAGMDRPALMEMAFQLVSAFTRNLKRFAQCENNS